MFCIGQFISTPAFDSTRNTLYVGNPVTGPKNDYYHGLIAFSVLDSCEVQLKWNTLLAASSPGSDNPWTSPVIAGDLVYIASGSFSRVHVIHADTGAIVWQSTEPLGFLFGSPSVVNGKMFIADAGQHFNGYSGRLWAYQMTTKPNTKLAPPSANFNITIGTSTYNMKALASTGAIDLTTGGLFQRVFNSSSPDAGYTTVYLRLPIAGVAPTAGLPYGFDWLYTDAWMIQGAGPTSIMLGRYRPKSWQQLPNGNLQVSLKSGSSCSTSFFRGTYSLTVQLQCSGGPLKSVVTFLGSNICQRMFATIISIIFECIYISFSSVDNLWPKNM